MGGIEMLACPFCGSPDVKVISASLHARQGYCNNCNAVGPYVMGEANAIAAWNRRALLVPNLGAVRLADAVELEAGKREEIAGVYATQIAELKAQVERLAAVIRPIMERTVMGNPDDPDAGTPEWEARFHEGWLASWAGYKDVSMREAAAWRALQPNDWAPREELGE